MLEPDEAGKPEIVTVRRVGQSRRRALFGNGRVLSAAPPPSPSERRGSVERAYLTSSNLRSGGCGERLRGREVGCRGLGEIEWLVAWNGHALPLPSTATARVVLGGGLLLALHWRWRCDPAVGVPC